MKKLVLLIITSITITLNVNAEIGDTIYVNQNATGANDGTSWADAYQELYDATDIAGSTQQIWVAAGTYKPEPSSRANAFEPNCNMFGGFNGTETQLSQRDWVANPTILSGDIGTVGDNTDNSQSVIEIQYAPEGAAIDIDGFTISGGYADGAAFETRYGGGIYVRNFAHPLTIRNCIIKDNFAHYEGGLHYRVDHNSAVTTRSLTIENTRFTNNYARVAAAFTVMARDTATVNVTIVNCLIDNNQTNYFDSSNPNVFPGGRFTQITSGQIHGRIINCTFARNVDNSSVADSSKAVLGIQIDDTNPVNDIEIHNTIFYGNTTNPSYTSIGYGTSNTYKPTNVNVYNTITEDILSNIDFVTSTNNTQVDPLFTNPVAGDFTLQSASPAINTGDTAGISSFIPTSDLAGNIRLNGIIDLGCYEDCYSMNITTTMNGTTITANENSTGVTYQWLDCNNNNAIIPNETAQSFTPTTTGNYACEITNRCTTDTTACVAVTSLGISENTIINQIAVYPNPTSSQLTITNIQSTKISVTILDLTGKTVGKIVPTSNTIDVSNLIKGIYLLQIQTKENLFSSKFIKE